ncbi:MAG: hypothetical protein KAR39_06575 [Thermoplasmata archaeon]|nr:hypothetical protein [Thermoplasmata archaeon]
MDIENRKGKELVGKENRRAGLSRIFAIAVFVSLVAGIPSVSITGIAYSDANADTELAMTEENMESQGTSVTQAPQMPGLDPVTNKFDASGIRSHDATPMGGMLLESLNFGKPTQEMTDNGVNPSPQGSPDPEPMDPPFMGADILVFNDAANSQNNPSITNVSNGELYTAYDHDPGTGLRDVHVSKSIDGGMNWMQRDIATTVGEDESCPSIDSTITSGGEEMQVWYNADDLEYAYSSDGNTWTVDTFGGGNTWWADVNCPNVAMKGDTTVVVAEFYDSSTPIDTWRIFYTTGGGSWTSYYFGMWPGAWIYRPRVSIQDDDEIVVILDVQDRTSPNPADWTFQAHVSRAFIANTGDWFDDSWTSFYYFLGDDSLEATNPTIAANGVEIVWAQELNIPPPAGPLNTHFVYCLWTDDLLGSPGNATWYGCAGTAFLAYDPLDTDDQTYPMLHMVGSTVLAVWLNGTNINYYFSPDIGNSLIGNLTTETPHKVNQPGVGTVLDIYHPLDVTSAGGKPCVAWQDTRGSESIYFNTFGNVVQYTIDTLPRVDDLWVTEVGDLAGPWRPPHVYTWPGGSSHDIETIGNFEIAQDTRYTFSQWDDGSLTNPTIITVGGDPGIVAIYDVEYYLTMVNLGTTTPTSGYQVAGALVTIEAFAPVAPPGARYIWAGWTGTGSGSYTGPLNPCTDCVQMNGTITQTAAWQLQWGVTINTTPVDLDIMVDGVTLPTPYVTWFNDSQIYILNAPSPQVISPVRYVWSNWSNGEAQMHNVFVTGARTFTANYTSEFWLTVDTNPSGLTIAVEGLNYTAPYSFWCVDGESYWLNPNSNQPGAPGERWAWRDWSDGGPQIHLYTCTGPATVTASYTLQNSVSIRTNPGGYDVIVDGMSVPTPVQYWWDDASAHTLEALPAIDFGSFRYSFTGWSDGGARIHTYYANVSNDEVIANYQLQYNVTLLANHPGLSIDLDSSPVALPYYYWCNQDTQHVLSAPQYQQFGDTRYEYTSWSDGGIQAHVITCTGAMVIRVDYTKEYKVRVNSTLMGVGAGTFNVLIGGNSYSTPAEVWWLADTMMTLDTDEFQPEVNPLTDTRYRFVDWDDPAPKTRSELIGAAGLEFVANFIAQHKLTFVDDQGTSTTTPAGYPVADGIYFDEATSVDIQTDDIVADTATHRWRFGGWTSGDLGGYSGPNNPGAVTVVGPITQTVTWVEQYLFTVVSPHGTPTVAGEALKVTDFEYWFDAGTQATFSIEAEIFTNSPTDTEKAVFDSWTGGTSPETINAPLEVIANWHDEYLVTMVSTQGTVKTPEWIVKGQTYALTIEDIVTSGDTRYVFASWSTTDTANGGYHGTIRVSTTLPVTGAITETALWTTEYRLTIVSSSGSEVEIGDPRTIPPAQEWVVEGTTVDIEVDKTIEIGDTRYKFKNWVGAVADPNSPATTVTVNGPTALTVEWDSEPTFSIMDLWWLFVVIIIVVVALVAVLLMRKKKPVDEEEIPPPEEDEFPEEEEAPSPPE